MKVTSNVELLRFADNDALARTVAAWLNAIAQVVRAGLTTFAVHHKNSPRAVVKFIEPDTRQDVLARYQHLDLQVEYELHANERIAPARVVRQRPQPVPHE